MTRKWFSFFALASVALLMCCSLSCGYNQHLESIQVLPSASGTFGGDFPNLFFDFKAYGTYIHPPQTKDITDQVTWVSDNPQAVQVSATGVVSPNVGCGLADIYATFLDGSNEIVSNSVPVTVDGPASSGCTPAGAQPVLTVSFAGTGTGTVTGSGISCTAPSACSNGFTAGTSLALTATPAGASTFGGWTNCSSTSGSNSSVCQVLVENNLTVTATFNP